jgi:nucleotide-binding universal stress UspA family protein
MSNLRRILVPVDFSTQGSQALRYGCALARQAGADVYLLHVVQDFPSPGVDDRGMTARAAADFLDEVEEGAVEALSHVPSPTVSRGVTVFRRTIIGSPWEEIVAFAKSNDIDLICVGTHGRSGFKRMVLGSVAEKVVQHADCDVLVVRTPEREFIHQDQESVALRRILVPTDFSDSSRLAIDEGSRWASQFQAELDLLHVVEDNSPSVAQMNLAHPVFQSYYHDLVRTGEQQLNEVGTSGLPAESVRRKVVVGDPIDKINDYAAEHTIDLIVMGTHGRRGPSHWMMGSVAERVVRSAPCPVLVVRSSKSAEDRLKSSVRELARATSI